MATIEAMNEVHRALVDLFENELPNYETSKRLQVLREKIQAAHREWLAMSRQPALAVDLDLLKKLRAAQKAYFKSRRPADLERSKKLEKELDDLLAEFEQGRLF